MISRARITNDRWEVIHSVVKLVVVVVHFSSLFLVELILVLIFLRSNNISLVWFLLQQLIYISHSHIPQMNFQHQRTRGKKGKKLRLMRFKIFRVIFLSLYFSFKFLFLKKIMTFSCANLSKKPFSFHDY